MSLKIIEAAFLSAEHRCQVRFPLEKFIPSPPLPWYPGKLYLDNGGGRDGWKLV